jgi:hypothetical protein
MPPSPFSPCPTAVHPNGTLTPLLQAYVHLSPHSPGHTGGCRSCHLCRCCACSRLLLLLLHGEVRGTSDGWQAPCSREVYACSAGSDVPFALLRTPGLLPLQGCQYMVCEQDRSTRKDCSIRPSVPQARRSARPGLQCFAPMPSSAGRFMGSKTSAGKALPYSCGQSRGLSRQVCVALQRPWMASSESTRNQGRARPTLTLKNVTSFCKKSGLRKSRLKAMKSVRHCPLRSMVSFHFATLACAQAAWSTERY